ncbi:MAG: hypothetical protein QNJ84_08105 [Alphaproteobacteria bacterium]|nr:hypothetical protein [Alphaproteobacteria bacterium]
MKRLVTVLAAPVFVAALSGAASASDDYYIGKWAFDEPEACVQADSDFMLIDPDGSFRIQHVGRARTVGYWSPDDMVLTMEVLTAPSSDKRRLWTYETIFSQDTVTIVVQERDPDHFKATASLYDESVTFDAFRCED